MTYELFEKSGGVIGWIRGVRDTREGDWRYAWETVQRGHAIVNSIHLAAVNRIGTEGDLQFWGSSFIADSFGNIIARAGEEEEVLLADILPGKNEEVREGWGFLRNRRPDTTGCFPKTGDMNMSELRKIPRATPKEAGFFMPAEWEKQEAVWLSWPQSEDTFPDLFAV